MFALSLHRDLDVLFRQPDLLVHLVGPIHHLDDALVLGFESADHAELSRADCRARIVFALDELDGLSTCTHFSLDNVLRDHLRDLLFEGGFLQTSFPCNLIETQGEVSGTQVSDLLLNQTLE